MNIRRIFAIMLRYWYNLVRTYDRLSDAFFWPVIDLVLLGITSKFIESVGNVPNILLMIVSGVVLWIILWRGQYEITVNFLEELWNKNLVNIFVSPLRFREWVAAVLLFGALKMMLSLVFASIVAYFMYATRILNYGFFLIPFAVVLLLSGWSIGLLISSILMRFGTKVQTLAWSAAYLLAPFSALYYPRSILPEWAQWISYAVAPSYVFESARKFVFNGTIDANGIIIGITLSILYFILGLFAINAAFQSAKKRGLINLY